MVRLYFLRGKTAVEMGRSYIGRRELGIHRNYGKLWVSTSAELLLPLLYRPHLTESVDGSIWLMSETYYEIPFVITTRQF